MSSLRTVTVGLISDTHGLLRPEAVSALQGSDVIIHAGDIGGPDVLDALSRVAPVTAVRGNNDKGSWASALPETDVLRIGATCMLVIHNLADLDRDPAAAGFHVVVSGHSHRPGQRMEQGVPFVNPGSAGPRRFKRPVAAGRLLVADAHVTPELFELPADGNTVSARPIISARRPLR
ncbi:MAG TPA: metallophosphoesterase family protein [Nitrospiria bacterium]|nr:metallophosphoesterase family protein [Nitrospiria bacterium]